MPEKTIRRRKNPFLSMMSKMAKTRGESLLDFAARLGYSAETIDQLEKNPWFNPSSRTIWVLLKDMEIYRREENAIVRLAEAVHQQDDATKKEELLHLYDSLPINFRHWLMDHIRKVVEDHFARKN